MDLSDLIERNATFTPDKAAIIFEGSTLTYAAFNARIERTACALKAELGVSRGDRVAILSLNRPDYLVLLYACARLGAILVPLNWRLAVAEQLFILSDASAKVLVLDRAFAEIVGDAPEGEPVRHRRVLADAADEYRVLQDHGRVNATFGYRHKSIRKVIRSTHLKLV